MNVLPALQHHLTQTTPHQWDIDTESFAPTLHTTIQTPIFNNIAHLITNITIIQHYNTLLITDGNKNQTIDLLDPNFLQKIHQFITTRHRITEVSMELNRGTSKPET